MAKRFSNLLPAVSEELKEAISRQLAGTLAMRFDQITSKRQQALIGKLMNMPQDQKTENDINRIFSFLKNQAFFRQLSAQVDPNILKNLWSQLTYEAFKEDQTVFEYGDLGDTFYIILTGDISIMVPNLEFDPENPEMHEDRDFGLVFSETWVLGPGDCFGELALLKKQPRAATVICKTESQLLKLDKESYNKILGGFDQERLSRITNTLHATPMFNSWTLNALSKFSYYWKEETFNRRQFIYKEGDVADRIYIVVTGEFWLTKRYPKPKFSKKRTSIAFAPKSTLVDKYTQAEIINIGPGDLFGEVEMEKDEENTRLTSCMWSHQSSAICIKKDDFYRRINHQKSWDHFEKVVFQRKIIILQRLQELENFYLKSQREETPSPRNRVRLESRPPSRNYYSLQTSPDLSPSISPRGSLSPAQQRKTKKRPEQKPNISMSRYISKISGGYVPGPLIADTNNLDADYLANRLYHFDKARADPEYWRLRATKNRTKIRPIQTHRRFSTAISACLAKKFRKLDKKVILSRLSPPVPEKHTTTSFSRGSALSR